ncbi:unnamed protein product [Rotaria sp. Silwood2]|nr:unnamed protein product [Rotaria sp. Silwood2]CAF3032626.1 unnamed protein product [Rotaria sp. Silwood2]CAF3233574.1 unnamed protein product [Rotaria sp. Silwood2]CAF3443757.1 unnamed protein product [Rotaria sp. Silwood2]CAF3962540.1 unnamed protein product [Rotaria sp. Silwood2]
MSSNTTLIRSITVYGGLPIFICGTLGNLLNIRFLWRTRRNPCAFIFLVSSFFNCIVLFYGLFTRILSVGFDLDWSSTNRIWCKTRIAFTEASFLISITCICLASIDRFLISCRQEKYRKLSKLPLTRWAIIIIILFWFGHSVPYVAYAELIQNSKTGLTSCLLLINTAYANYLRYVALPVYLGLFPSTILTITGLMTYRNTNKLQMLRQRQLVQKQLTSMILTQIPIILFSTLPYIIFTEYTAVTSTMIKSTNEKAVELVVTNIATLLFYITFACPFFVFFASSASFRREAKRFFLCQKTNLFKTNRIQPYSTATIKNIQPAIVNDNKH